MSILEKKHSRDRMMGVEQRGAPEREPIWSSLSGGNRRMTWSMSYDAASSRAVVRVTP